ncbi:unnamed protein product, partial [Thlaspi arvense]
MKLLIDEKKNKVVLAEANQDFVDVLISLLTLPMDKIAKLNFNTSRCRCGALIYYQILVPEEDQVGEVIGDSADGVFVSSRSSFIMTDDLNVTLNSIGVIMKVLNDLGYHGFSDLRETQLDVGLEEVLMKPCITSKLEKLSSHVQKKGCVDPGSVYSVKVYVRKLDGEILYAECNEDFVDSLLSFLIFPLELACSFSIPHNSWEPRILAKQIKRSLISEGGKIVKVFPNNSKIKPGTSLTCRGGFMKRNTKFIVSNDLIITQMNSSSTIGLLKKMKLISILKTSLVSSSALTIGLSNLLVKKPKEET